MTWAERMILMNQKYLASILSILVRHVIGTEGTKTLDGICDTIQKLLDDDIKEKRTEKDHND